MSRPVAACRLFVSVVVTLAVASCSGSSTPTTTPPAASVTTVAVSPPTATLTASQTVQLTATPKDSSGNAISGQTISWSSTAPGVASVNSSGLVTGVAVGTASITATTGGKSGVAAISVGEATTVGAAGGTVTAAGGNVVLQFPAGAFVGSTVVTVAPATTPAGTTGAVAGTAFEFGPSGSQFTTPVLATIKYQPAFLPTGTAATDLHIYTWGGGNSWTRMSATSVDTVNHTVSAMLPHFSIFSVCGLFCSPVLPPTVPGLNIGSDYCPSLTVAQGGSSPNCTGVLESSGAYATGISFSIKQTCAYSLGCTLLPVGAITGTFSIVGNVGGDVNAPAGFGVSFLWSLHVAPTTPPGVYIVFVDALTTVSGVAMEGQSMVTYVYVPAPGYTPTLGVPGVSVAQGSSGGTTVTIARQNGFAGAVTLSVERLPSGVTATLNPASVTGTTSSLTLNVATSVLPGDYTLTLRSTAAGFADQTILFGLTVTGSGFSLAGTPPSISTTAGSTAKTGIKATRASGFSNAINYAVSGLPSGLTATITSSSVADSSVLSVTATAGLAAGNYPILVTATATGAATQQLTVTVTIAPAGVLGVHLDFSGCSQAAAPIWVAYQDGSGPFTHVTLSGTAADFNISSSKAAVAIVSPNGSAFSTMITYLTQAELLTFNTNGGFGGCGPTSGPTNGKTVNASVVSASDVYMSLGGGTATTAGANPGLPVQLVNVASGSQDAFAFALLGSYTVHSPQVIVRRDQNIPNGGSLAVFDFGSGEAVTAASGTATVGGGVAVNMSMGYIAVSNGVCVTNRNLYVEFSTQSGSFPIYGIPTALQRPGDLHIFSAVDASGQSVSTQFHTFTSQNLSFGDAITPTVTATAGTYRLLSAALTVPAEYQNVGLYYVDAGGTGNSVNLQASTGYFGTQSITLAAPDLGNIGYLASWGPTAGGTANYSVGAGSSNNFISTPASRCADGLTMRSTGAHGTK